ncbi:MAG: 6,7-dimethyl-8-ribityllumazine synthase [Euryarchaeota archaeon RBG_16_68_12]|nr:MAG: 6,7-dimethyl-8-ribityllumazine synthase [Euryarchaeota archaeon RBG_16_68_12]
MTVRLAIVAASFNAEITDRMVERALARAEELGAEAVVVRVPGTFEIPAALHRLLRRKDVDGGVAIGAVVKGQTKHDELIAHAVARKLLDLQIETGKPIGLGITGPGMSYKVALRRIGNAARAVDAVVAMAGVLRGLR